MEENRRLIDEAAEAPETEDLPQDAGTDAAAEAIDALRAELEAKLRQMLDEQLKLSRMTDAERADYEAGCREDELEQREKAVSRRELRADAMEALEARGLPKALADAVCYDGAEAMRASMDAVETAFREAVQAAVEDRLRGGSPEAGASAQGVDMDQLDDASYYKMTSAVR